MLTPAILLRIFDIIKTKKDITMDYFKLMAPFRESQTLLTRPNLSGILVRENSQGGFTLAATNGRILIEILTSKTDFLEYYLVETGTDWPDLKEAVVVPDKKTRVSSGFNLVNEINYVNYEVLLPRKEILVGLFEADFHCAFDPKLLTTVHKTVAAFGTKCPTTIQKLSGRRHLSVFKGLNFTVGIMPLDTESAK